MKKAWFSETGLQADSSNRHAWRRADSGWDVQLCFVGAAGSDGSSVARDKAYDTKDFVSTVRELNVTPHITKNGKRLRSNLDRRTTRQPGYAVSLKHWPDPHFEKLSTEKKRKSQEKTLRCSDFQQVLRWISNARTFSTLRWWRSAPLKRALRNVSTNSQASAGPITCPPSEKTFMSSSSTPW